jgi:hypothetical protein
LDSTLKITVTDLASFIGPIRYLGTNVGTRAGDIRWDLAPGKGIFGTDVNIVDLTALTAVTTGYPPMLAGARAFNGPACPWP